jgi:hypothetical protein
LVAERQVLEWVEKTDNPVPVNTRIATAVVAEPDRSDLGIERQVHIMFAKGDSAR